MKSKLAARGASAFTQPEQFLSGVDTHIVSRIEDEQVTSWANLIDELLRIRNLQDDWDGEGTEAPHPSLVDGAIKLAQCLEARNAPPADRVFASVNGTIYFEWHTPTHYQEIEVVSPVEAESRTVQKGSDSVLSVTLSYR